MHAWYIFSVWLHILAAIAWIGGAIFLAAVIVPCVRRPELREHAALLIQITGRRFKYLGWGCLLILVVTGITNLTFKGLGPALHTSEFWTGPFGSLLAHKISLVLLILVLSAAHDFYIGPRAAESWRTDPDSARTKRLRKAASWMGRINLLLALVVVALGIMLWRGKPW